MSTKYIRTNRHGLSRWIPEPVKRLVRQYCGFGCVHCGYGYCEYHHFDPPFKEAKEHRADRIMLLCGKCHGLQKSGVLSDQTLLDDFQNPMCLKRGQTRADFDVSGSAIEVSVGSVAISGACKILRVFGEEVFSILPPENRGAPYRLNAILYDKEDNPIFVMRDNVWEAGVETWDVELDGKLIVVRLALREIVLRLRQEPPNRFIVEKLAMNHRGVHINASEGEHLIVDIGGGEKFESREGRFEKCDVAFDIDDDGLTIGQNYSRIEMSDFRLNS